MKTAALIIIGNEILSGRVADTNSPYLCSELRALGVSVKRISVIPDNVDTIAAEVSSLSKGHDFVLTTGGIGPTHDDMTIEGVSRAFGMRTVTDQRILALMRNRCGGMIADVAHKMAEIPEGAEIIEIEGMNFPPVVVGNVYVFPGVPKLLVRKFEAIKGRFSTEAPFMIRKLYLDAEECVIADHLDRVDKKYDDVEVGSYPYMDTPGYRVIVTLESRAGAALDAAFDELIRVLPKGSLVRAE